MSILLVDGSSVERLSAEDAAAHGFPTVEMKTECWSEYRDITAYEGMWKLHELKGYPLDSQAAPVFEIFWDNVATAGLKCDFNEADIAQEHDVAHAEDSIPATDSLLVPWWKWNLPEFGSLC
ncbi:hypothetical protein FB45DRAFT_1034304 [Roridomyces roridus]|uniref:Uncharacterized protein n=1 Tax=Roridomyces roridus TaxID=1738132 RepID=A0AAD7BDK7_9AGAR|nr:hypothetical protein FB45DRAFT_1034304 [Roridomyces roridus]